MWDAVTTAKKQTVRLKSSYVMSVCMEKEGRFVAAGGLDNACSVYRVGGEQSKLSTELVSHEGYLADCKFFHSPAKMLTASADATSLLWDVEKGQIIEMMMVPFCNFYDWICILYDARPPRRKLCR